MVRVLVIGYAPDATDFTDPALPSGLDAAKIAVALRRDVEKMHDRGWEAEHFSIRPDDAQLRQRIVDHLSGSQLDCVVIGGGVRMTTKHVSALEVVVNAVREGAPTTPIAFNSGPDTSGEAAARWVGTA